MKWRKVTSEFLDDIDFELVHLEDICHEEHGKRITQLRKQLSEFQKYGETESQSSALQNQDELTINDYKEVIEDNKRLVRELDVIINGKNAAKQASLCDIVAQLKSANNPLPNQDAETLRKALLKAVEIIKQWHNMPNSNGRLHNFEMGKMWEIYYNNAPEMKEIRTALKGQ